MAAIKLNDKAREEARQSLHDMGFIQPEHRKYEIKTSDGRSLGSVSYGAKNAIEREKLDSYVPKDDDEKRVIDAYKSYASTINSNTGTNTTSAATKKDGFVPWLGKQAMAGLSQFNKSIAATLDFILPTEFLGRYDFVSNINDYYSKQNNYRQEQAVKSSVSRGKGWDVGGEVVSGTIAALPNAILAYMTAGTSLGTQGLNTGLRSGAAVANAVTGNTTKQMLGNTVKTVVKNPMYWSSFLQTVGNDYEEAKENGANEFVASSTAILTSLLNAGVEIGGGIETLPQSVKNGGKKAVLEWVKSSLEEGREEVIQGLITNSIAKMAYDSDRQVLNPTDSAKEFALGAAVGGVLGGAQTAVGAVANTASFQKTGKIYNDPETSTALIDQGLQSPEGTESREIAEKLDKRLSSGKKISNSDLGRLVYANELQISKENNSIEEKSTSDDAGVSVGDTFKDTKTGNKITVVKRDNENTTVEIGTGAKTEIRELSNSLAKNLVTNERYTPVTTNYGSTKNIALTQVGDFYEAYGADAMVLSEKLGLTPTTKDVNGERAAVVGFPVSVLENYKNALGNDYNVMVADDFNKNVTEEKTEPRLTGSDAQVYSILTSNLKNAAYEHGLMDTDFYDRLSEVNLYAPSVRDVALINSEFRRVFANTDDARIVSWLNGLGNLQARLTSINEQNMPVSTENTPVNEDVTNINVINHAKEVDGLKLVDTEKSTLVNGKTLITGVYELNSDKDFNRKSYKKEEFNIFCKSEPWISTVEGTTYGHYGFSKSGTSEYIVTYLPVGLSVTKANTVNEAKLLLKTLEDNLPELPLSIKSFGDGYHCYGLNQGLATEIKNVIDSAAESASEINLPLKNKKELITYLKQRKGEKIGVSYNQGAEDIRTIVSASDTAIVTERADGQRGRLSAKANELSYTDDGFVYTGDNGVIVSYRFITEDNSSEEVTDTASGTDTSESVTESAESKIKNTDSVTEAPENVVDTEETTPVGQLLEDYNDTVDNILSVSDETAKEFADKRVAVEVLKNTPTVILDNVEDARDLKVIINYNKLYLAVRKSGVFKGHYHNLGADIAKRLPEFLNAPDAIIQLANGRLNLFATVVTERGNNGIVSVELNNTKDINGKYEDYNVVVTMFSSDDKYAQNLISGDGVTEKYKREDLSQVNPQLYKWLAIINDKSSVDNIVSQNNDVVNNSVRTDTKNDASKVYDVAYFEKLGSDIRKGESVSLKDVRTAVDTILLNHGEAIKAELSQLKNDELKKHLSIYDRGRITKKAEMVDSIYTDMLSSLYYALSGKETITYVYDGTGFEAQQSKMLFDISRELTEETFNKRLAENAEKNKKQVAAREEKLAKVKNPQTLEDYSYKKRYFGLSDEETIQYENLYAEERRKAREEKKAAKTTKDTSGANAFFANTDNYTIEKTTHTKTGEDVWVVRPASRLETEQWKQLNEHMKALGGSYWRGNQGWNFKKDPTAALSSTEESETETVKGSTNAKKLRAVAEGMQKAIDDKFRDRLTNTAKRAREAASAEAEGERLKRLQDIINNIAGALENGENTLLDKIDSKAQVETLMSMLRAGRRNRINETMSGMSYDERTQEEGKPFTNDDVKYAEYPLTKVHENIVSGYLRAAEGKTGYKQIADRLKKAIKSAKDGYVSIDTQLLSDIEKIVQNMTPFYEQFWNDGVAERKRLARMGIENVVELRAYLREFIKFLPEKDADAERQRNIKAKERQLANSKIEGFFPTPKAIVEKMLDEADIKPGEKVLEPSAGKGNIADAIRENYPDNALDVVEWNASLNELLSEKGHNVVGVDFLQHSGEYDKIIMNPPFEKGQDIDHIRHAYSLLNDGGRVVCIMSEGPFYRSDKKATEFREWLDSLGGVSEKLPEGAFKSSERSTGVNTRLVVIDKAASATKPTKSKSGVKSSRDMVKKENAKTLTANSGSETRISVNTNELPVKFTNVNEARKAFVNYTHDNFPKSVVNINTQAEIGISRTGIDKFLSGNISMQKYATGFKIPELIESAVKVGEAENKKGKSGINGYEYYNNLISIDGKDFSVHIRVRKTDMGDKYYGHTISHDVEDIKIEPLAWNSDKKSVHSINASNSITDIVSQNDIAVNNNSMPKTENRSNTSQIDDAVRSSKDIATEISRAGDEKTAKSSAVLLATKNTIKPEITSNLKLMGMLSNKFGGDGMDGLVDEIVTRYNKRKTIGDFENLFIDGGKEIYNALRNREIENAKYSISERGAILNEKTGNDLLLGNSRRTGNESAREQTRKFQDFKQKNQGKAEGERKATTEKLLAKGQTQQKIITTGNGKIRINVINSDNYDADMKSIVESFKENGIETILFVGKGEKAFDSNKKLDIDGFVIENKVYLRYDGKIAPQVLKMHEMVHFAWNAPEMQNAKESILGKMTQEQISSILNEPRYLDYAEIYGDEIDAILEEFVADTFSGINTHTIKYIDMVSAYWNGEEYIDNYRISEYTESIDSGGKKDRFVLMSTDDIPYREKKQLEEYIISRNNSGYEIKTIDCKEIGNNFYIWENTGKVDYEILGVVEIEGNEDDIDFLRGEINGFNRGKKRISDMYQSFNGRNRNGDRGGFIDQDKLSNASNDQLSDKTSSRGEIDGDRRRNTEKSTGDKSEGEVKFSISDNNSDFWNEWLRLAKDFGVIPKGENPTRDIDVPKKITKDKLVSRFARTMLEAGVTPETAVSEFERRVLDGSMTHEVVTDDGARKWAIDQIKYHGFKEAMNTWNVYSRDNNIGKKELALGMELYNQCITNGDVTNAMKIAVELAAEATHAGQTLQATRMLKLMTPDGQLYFLEKSLKKMNDEFKKKIGDKYKDIKLDKNLMKKFLIEKNDNKRNKIYDDICQNIAGQIPATLIDKWDSWRYLAMLGNPRTHIRNIAGNGVFILPIKLKNYIGAAMESAAKISTSERTKSLRKSKKAVEFAKKDFTKMVKVLQGENAKYAITSDIESKRTIFKTKWLENLRNKNFEWLEKEDMWFLKMHYIDALARILTARKIDLNNVNEKTLDNVRAYAVREAQRATYRDANSLAEALNKLQKKASHSDKKAIRATNVLLEGVMPFKKTPLNIAKQGVQYSPVGILSGVYKTVSKMKNGDAYSTTDIIDDFAKGLTGTAFMLLGTFLASLGLLSGGNDEDKKKKEFDKMVGEQSFSLNIGDNSYTIDWMTPLCLPLFTGVELYKLTADDFEFADIVNALSSLTDPLLELSVLSGVSGAIESAQYNDTNTLFAIGSDMTISYLMQALPTIGGQISRIIDKNKREYYYTDKNSSLPKVMQNFLGQISSKIPFASLLFEPAIDEWGREVSYGGLVERIFENVVSPGYYSGKNYTSVDEKIKQLYEKTGNAGVLPTIQQKSYTQDYVTYPMTAAQYTKVKSLRGKKSFEYLTELFNDELGLKFKDEETKEYQYKVYSEMSDEEKITAIKKCYKQAGEETKEIMFEEIKRNR